MIFPTFASLGLRQVAGFFIFDFIRLGSCKYSYVLFKVPVALFIVTILLFNLYIFVLIQFIIFELFCAEIFGNTSVPYPSTRMIAEAEIRVEIAVD